MKTSSLSELKKELQAEKPARLIELCLRLARFKKENKELLTYLLFEAHDTENYIAGVKNEMDTLFEGINLSNLYFAKKTLRKILRITNKFIRYSGSDVVATELLIHFCKNIRKLEIPVDHYPVIKNLYQNQLKRIQKSLAGMHEDLQYDYREEIESITAQLSEN
jgi:hypothetical protein